MTGDIRIELARAVDARGVADALIAYGLTPTVVEVNGTWEVDVPDADRPDDVLTEVRHALDDWAAARHLPFVTTQVAEGRLTIRPPCG